MIEVGRAVVVAVVSGLALVLLAWAVLRPPRRLAGRVWPYVPGAEGRAIRGVDATVSGGLDALIGPMVRGLGAALASIVDAEPEERTRLRLLHAGVTARAGASLTVLEYRTRQLVSTTIGAVGGWVAGSALLDGGGPLGLAALGAVIGSTRLRGRVDRAIEARRARMRIEVYTVNQMLALRVRSGAGVLQAIEEYVAGATGEVASELGEGLRLARAGLSTGEALDRLAERTPEPFCARTYRALGIAGDRGADLALVLLDLAEEVRRDRREALRRRAVKRRAAMLIPTIGLMAPVLLLFIAAPLPRIVLGSL